MVLYDCWSLRDLSSLNCQGHGRSSLRPSSASAEALVLDVKRGLRSKWSHGSADSLLTDVNCAMAYVNRDAKGRSRKSYHEGLVSSCADDLKVWRPSNIAKSGLGSLSRQLDAQAALPCMGAEQI